MATAEMKILRWSCGVTRLDKIRNEEIRRRFKVAPIVEKLESQRLRWFGHVCRREESHICRKVQTIKIDGKGKQGRPAKSWADCIKRDLNLRGLTAENAMDRKEWKESTQTADPKWQETPTQPRYWD